MGEAAACARYGHIVGGKRCLWVRLYGEVGSPARGDNFESYADRVGEASAISVHRDVAGGSFAPSKDCESCSCRRVRGDNYIGWADFPGGAVGAWAEW